MLNHNAGHLSGDQAELTQRLDLLRNQLNGAELCPPRAFQALLATAREQPWSEESQPPDPGRPLSDVERAARAVTDRHFLAEAISPGRAMLLYGRIRLEPLHQPLPLLRLSLSQPDGSRTA